jgi:hypothetical protein
MNFFPSINELFNALNEIYSDNYKSFETKKTVTANETSFTTSMDGVSLTTAMDTNGNVTFKANITIDESDKDAKNNVVNILLSKAELLFNKSNNVKVELTINDKLYTFTSVSEVYDNVVFVTTNTEGVEGYMYHLTTDENEIKEWFFTESLYATFGLKDSDCREGCVSDDCEICSCEQSEDKCPAEPVDETHVYTDEEMNAYANFMCNVVCGDCDKNSCVGCEVVGESDDSNDNPIIPDSIEDKDFASFIKGAHKSYVDSIAMMKNLRSALISGKYERENDCIVVMLEDLICTDCFFDDVNVGKHVLSNELNELQTFLHDAVAQFGFKSASYNVDGVFNDLIDLRFYLPE